MKIELYGGPADGLEVIVDEICRFVDVPDGDIHHLYGMLGDPYRFAYRGAVTYRKTTQVPTLFSGHTRQIEKVVE